MSTTRLAADFRTAMRGLASTVTIVSTAGTDGARHGMTATAVQSLSLDPPSLLVCVNHGASLHGPMLDRGSFCVNVLTTLHGRLVGPFSGELKGEARFGLGRWEVGEAGLPYLADARCNVFCHVDRAVAYGTHSIVIGRVFHLVHGAPHGPLLYAEGRLGAARLLAE